MQDRFAEAHHAEVLAAGGPGFLWLALVVTLAWAVLSVLLVAALGAWVASARQRRLRGRVVAFRLRGPLRRDDANIT